MRIFFAHLKIRWWQMLREPAYVASTLIFPSLFFLIFALPNADTNEKAKVLMGSFAGFAVLGVCVFQFGVHFAQEMRSGWFAYLKTMPAPPLTTWLALTVNSLLFAALAAWIVFLTVKLTTVADVSVQKWLLITVLLVVGAIPFALFSAAVAHWTTAQSALPIFNLIYILGSFAGGLWMPPEALPKAVEKVSVFLPSRHLGEILWKAVLDQKIELKYVAYLFLFGVVSVLVLALSHRLFSQNAKI
jgi:ABC-2 type transport system permease protein